MKTVGTCTQRRTDLILGYSRLCLGPTQLLGLEIDGMVPNNNTISSQFPTSVGIVEQNGYSGRGYRPGNGTFTLAWRQKGPKQESLQGRGRRRMLEQSASGS